MKDLLFPKSSVIATEAPLVPDVDAPVGVARRTAAPSVTLGGLEVFVRAKVRDRAETGQLAANQIKQRVEHAVAALNRAGLKRDARLPARPALEASLAHAEERAKKKNDRKPLSQAKMVLELLGELEADLRGQAETSPGSPNLFVVAVETFGTELRCYRELAGYSQNALAKKFDIHSSIISRWEDGMLPEDNEKRRALVVAIGDAIGCGGEHLWALAGDQLRVIDEWPEEVPEKMRVRVSKLSGNLRGLSSLKRREARLNAYAELMKQDDDRPQRKPYSLGFDIDAWPRLLAEDWKWHLRMFIAGEELSPEEKPIIKLSDSEKNVRPIDPRTGKRIYAPGKPMKNATAFKNTKTISLVLGSCVNLERPEEVALEPQADGSVKETLIPPQPAPLNLDHIAEFGFSLLAVPALIEHYFAVQKHFKGLHKAKDGTKRVGKLTREQSRNCGLMRKILECLGQQPHFANRLVPIAGLVTDEDVRRAKADWKKFCGDASDRYKTIYDGEKHRISAPIDHGVAIDGILDSEEPQRALLAVFAVHSSRLGAIPERARRRAHQLRKAFASGLKAQAYLRPGTEQRLNLKNLVCRVERGKVVWRLQAPKEFFKNADSPAMKNGENRKLVDLGDVFYDVIEEYLEWARDFLLGEAKTDALIVRTPSNPRHVGDKSFSDWWGGVSADAMVEDRPEFCGAKRLNSIQARKIGATDTFVKTGKIEEAAKTLGNTTRAAEVYVKKLAAAQTENSSQRVSDADAVWRGKNTKSEPVDAT